MTDFFVVLAFAIISVFVVIAARGIRKHKPVMFWTLIALYLILAVVLCVSLYQ